MPPQISQKKNPNPDSMVSTWRRDKSQWNTCHWIIELLGLHLIKLDGEVPVFSKNEKIPATSEWSLHSWILLHAAIPLLIHQVYTTYTGKSLNIIEASALYSAAFNVTGVHGVNCVRRLGQRYGFLDGDKHARDDIPDVGVVSVLRELIGASTIRILITIYMTYQISETPTSLHWEWLVLEIGLYTLAVDFWYYWWHRMLHESVWLWKFHRKHHLTKHPHPMLFVYADYVEEFVDLIVVPVLAYWTLKVFGLPLGFYEWWVCLHYVIFAELAGHSGLRMHGANPSPFTWALRFFGAELVIEDHDLHHRFGSKKSYNYGKQSRLWDRIFGTCRDRIEGVEENIDWENRVYLPFF